MKNKKPNPWLMFSLACFCIFGLFISIFSIPPLIGTLVIELGISYAQAGIFMTAFSVMFCFGGIIAGFLSDRFGAKRVIVAGLILGYCAAYFFAFSRNFGHMVIFRAIIGCSAACLWAPGIAFILSWLPKEKANIGISSYNASIALGLGITFLFTPIMAPLYGWGFLLRVYVLSGVAIALIFWVLARDKEDITASPTQMQVSVRQESLLRNTGFLFVCFGLFFAFFQLYGLYTWIPPYLSEVCKLSPGQVGIASLVLSLGAVPAGLTGGWIADKTGKRIGVVMMGLLISLTSVLPIWLTKASFLQLTVACFVVQWGVNMAIGPFFTLPAMLVPASVAGKATGFASTCALAGPIVSTYLGGYVVTKTGSYNLAFIIFAFSGLAAFAFCMGFKKVPHLMNVEKEEN